MFERIEFVIPYSSNRLGISLP